MTDAQTIMQWLCSLRNYQYIVRQVPDDPVTREAKDSLEERLRWGIAEWGGLDKIETWLVKHDPGHSTPSRVIGLDWSWLPEAQGVKVGQGP